MKYYKQWTETIPSDNLSDIFFLSLSVQISLILNAVKRDGLFKIHLVQSCGFIFKSYEFFRSKYWSDCVLLIHY